MKVMGVKLPTEYVRYNPSKRQPRYPYQWKVGRFGKVHRSNTVTTNARLRRKLKDNPGKWFKTKRR